MLALGVKLPEWRTTETHLDRRSEKQGDIIAFLHDAAKHGKIDVVRSLVLDTHLNPNSRDRKGWTALLRAAKCDQLEIVDFLIKAKANMECKTKEGNAPLHKAVKRGKLEAVRLLCKSGADTNVENNGQATPLMLAAMHRSAEPHVKVLLKHGADVNKQKDVGYTALMICARMGNTRVAKLLLEAEADMELRDKSGETAIAKARKHNQQEVVQMLHLAGAKDDEPHGHRGSSSHLGRSHHASTHGTSALRGSTHGSRTQSRGGYSGGYNR